MLSTPGLAQAGDQRIAEPLALKCGLYEPLELRAIEHTRRHLLGDPVRQQAVHDPLWRAGGFGTRENPLRHLLHERGSEHHVQCFQRHARAGVHEALARATLHPSAEREGIAGRPNRNATERYPGPEERADRRLLGGRTVRNGAHVGPGLRCAVGRVARVSGGGASRSISSARW